MSDSLQQQYADERSESIRSLLVEPMINNSRNTDVFRLIVRHESWLVEWFELTVGWRLEVDIAAGFARLFKRSQSPDPSRVLHSTRGQKRAFDRRRYQLLCMVCAYLVKNSVTTIGLLASTLGTEANLDTTIKRERAALVDALRKLMEWEVITLRSGEIDAYLESKDNNAMVYADTHRLHHLLSSATAASKLSTTTDALHATDTLLDEPRYAGALKTEDEVTEAERLRYARHTAARRLLDDPVVYFIEQPPNIAAYLEQGSSKRWLRDKVADAGFELEERLEGMMVIDTSATATDKRFPSPIGTVGQVALLLIESLIKSNRKTGERHLTSLSTNDQKQFIKRLFKLQPHFAKSWREGNEPMRLVAKAITLLQDFDLLEVDTDGRVTAKPALARYRVDDTAIDHAQQHNAIVPKKAKQRSGTNSTVSTPASEGDADNPPPPTQTTLL